MANVQDMYMYVIIEILRHSDPPIVVSQMAVLLLGSSCG